MADTYKAQPQRMAAESDVPMRPRHPTEKNEIRACTSYQMAVQAYVAGKVALEEIDGFADTIYTGQQALSHSQVLPRCYQGEDQAADPVEDTTPAG